MVTNGQGITILVIDSEKESVTNTINLLQKIPHVSITEVAHDTDQAIRKTISYSPDVILFDYPPKGDSEKELIKLIKTKLPETTLVLTSHTKDYAAFAIQNGIFKYLLKPLQKDDLDKIINWVQEKKQNQIGSRIDQIIDNNPETARLKLQTTKGYFILNPEELIYCKATGFYTELYLTRDRVELSTLYLMKFEEILSRFNFCRVSRSYLINQKYIRKIYKSISTIILAHEGKEYKIKGAKSHIRQLSKFENE